MTTATVKPVRRAVEDRRHRAQRVGREVGTLAVNVYERGVGDVVAFEKDAAKITPFPWMKSALTVSADLIGDIGAAYVKTARQVLR